PHRFAFEFARSSVEFQFGAATQDLWRDFAEEERVGDPHAVGPHGDKFGFGRFFVHYRSFEPGLQPFYARFGFGDRILPRQFFTCDFESRAAEGRTRRPPALTEGERFHPAGVRAAFDRAREHGFAFHFADARGSEFERSRGRVVLHFADRRDHF